MTRHKREPHGLSMTSDAPLGMPKGRSAHYTYLVACIREEDHGYLLQVTLCDSRRRSRAWGEDMADTFEQASDWIGALAAEFSIATRCIEIELRMDNPRDGTRH